jgi:AcrR family transcriptional regulator
MAAIIALPGARDRLLDAALHRIAADGAVAVNLDDIRRDAGVSVGALYHHFADKADLVDALYRELASGFQAEFIAELRASPGAEDGIRGGVRLYARWIARHRDEATVLLQTRTGSPALRELNRRFLAEVRTWWDTHAHYGALKALPLDLIHALWLGPAHEYARHWLAGNAKRPPGAVVTVLEQAAWDALKEDS